MKKIFKFFLALLIIKTLIINPNFVFANETENEIKEISTAGELQSINQDLDGRYILKNDIDLKGVSWEPIVNFRGRIDGNGFKIKNLSIESSSDNIGLISTTKGAVLENIILENANVKGKAYVGGIVGIAANDTVIKNCFVIGGKIEATLSVIGGISGELNSGSIIEKSGTSNIIKAGNNPGGAGGLTGRLQPNTQVINSYSISQLSGIDNVYGIGYLYALDTNVKIINSYFAGTISSITNKKSGLSNSSKIIENSYYDMEISNVKVPVEWGKTTKEMMNKATYKDFDFENVWGFKEGYSYPVLNTKIENGGLGTNLNPYLIKTVEDLQNINQALDSSYILSNDIDLKGFSWEPIVNFRGRIDGNGFKIKNLSIESSSDNIGLISTTKGAVLENIILENANVKGKAYVGGIVGIAANDTLIKNCFVIGGKIEATLSVIGGISGELKSGSIIEKSGTSNIIKAGDNAGGAGGLTGRLQPNTQVINSYSISQLSGIDNVYGIGYLYALDTNVKIINSYFAGTISSITNKKSGLSNSSKIIENSYYDMEISNVKVPVEWGKTTKEMMNKATYKGFDFDSVWSIDEGKSYPVLNTKIENGGLGTNLNPYLIKTAEDLQNINQALDGSYILSNDIDLKSLSWKPIVGFRGRIDGNGFKIKNLSIESTSDRIGLISTTKGAILENIILENANVKGKAYVGGIVGIASNDTLIKNCFVIGGKIEATLSVIGGISGELNSGSIIEKSGTSNIIKAGDNDGGAGGLTGRLQPNTQVINSYSISQLSGINNVYGIGYLYALDTNVKIINSYFAGTISSITNKKSGLSNSIAIIENSYYDMEISNVKVPVEWGKTTKEMMNKATYKGFDFENVWGFKEGYSYPVLNTKIENGGLGTNLNPYLIKTAEDLQNINQALDGSYILSNDIDLKSLSWKPIVGFRGRIDGNGFKIKNLSIESTSDRIGLISTTKGAILENIILENANVKGKAYVGGIVGIASNDTLIKNCFVIGGKIEATLSVIGGISGELNSGSIIEKSGTSNIIKAGDNAGGAGGLTGRLQPNTQVINSYSTSQLSGINNVYGIGYLYSSDTNVKIINSYFAGTISSITNNKSGLSNSSTIIENSYYDMEISNIKVPVEWGKTTKEMMNKSTYKGFDFDSVWSIDEGKSYPVLNTKIENGGLGTNLNPYLIKTAEDLQNINQALDGSYILSNDIDLKSLSWKPIVGFRGRIDGNGFKIKNLSIESSSDNIGLISTTKGAVLENIILENANVKGKAYVGGIVGIASNDTLIKNCFVIGGKIEATLSVIGGISGELNSGSIIEKSGTSNIIKAGDNDGGAGGLTGRLQPNTQVINSYSISQLSGINNVYGIGYLYALDTNVKIINSYFAGTISSITNKKSGLSNSIAIIENSYYDMEISNVKVPVEWGKTTKEMMNKATYKGFDFENVWGFKEGYSYPVLNTKIENGGLGTNLNPYLIKTAEDLQNINQALDGSYILSNDIDLKSLSWKPIVGFRGRIDGNGFKIKNLSIESTSDRIGLISTTKGAILENIILENANVKGKAYVGGIVGIASNDTLIKNCFVIGGKIEATLSVIGGISGELNSGSIIEKSGTSNIIKAGDNDGGAGGLTGRLQPNTQVINSYSISQLSGINNVYGIGYLYALDTNVKIINSYFAGTISSITNNKSGLSNSSKIIENSYHDMEISNVKVPVEWGKTTKEMMNKATYKDFDFENVWVIDEGKSYPTLQNKKTNPENPNPEPIENDFIEDFIGLWDVTISKDNEVTINVDEKATEILINIKVADGATWVLYEDKELTKKIESNIINLTEDISEAYIEVTLANGTKGIFSVKVFKQTGSVIDPSLPVVKGKATYTYDKVGRLIEVLYESGDKIIYTYDAAGNILEVKKQI